MWRRRSLYVRWQTAQGVSEARPPTAAADEMLKRIVARLQEDLDRQYIQPMLVRLRTDLIDKGPQRE
jgi:hypothetical protein